VDLDNISDYTKLSLQISRDTAVTAGSDHLEEELHTPEWSASGIFLSLMTATAASLDPAEDNRLVYSASPLTVGPALDVWISGNSLLVNLPMDLLEARLGGWVDSWYFACWAMIDGQAPVMGGVMEVTESTGGIADIFEPDVYDFIFSRDPRLENRMLANYSSSRSATLDAVGRGFAAVHPATVGPLMAAAGPQVEILTQPSQTVQSQRLVSGTVDGSLLGQLALVHRVAQGQTDTTWLDPQAGEWSVQVSLEEGENIFQAAGLNSAVEWGISNQLSVLRTVEHAPQVEISYYQIGQQIVLNGSGTQDIDSDISSWFWEAETGNPGALPIDNPDGIYASIDLTGLQIQPGSYWLRLNVSDLGGHQEYARVLLDIDSNGNLINRNS
jgi:hypothetical protein